MKEGKARNSWIQRAHPNAQQDLLERVELVEGERLSVRGCAAHAAKVSSSSDSRRNRGGGSEHCDTQTSRKERTPYKQQGSGIEGQESGSKVHGSTEVVSEEPVVHELFLRLVADEGAHHALKEAAVLFKQVDPSNEVQSPL